MIKGQVLSKATVYTDGWLGYDGLVLGGYRHRRIYHHDNEFARGKNHVNGIESFWSYAKFRFIKLRGVRPEFFFQYKGRAVYFCSERCLGTFVDDPEKYTARLPKAGSAP